MKINIPNTFKGSSSVGTALTINAGAAAFNALSSGIYSDKIKAFIREICCNAYDAWTQQCRNVGIANASPIPFEIKLPNAIDPVFYVRDFGTGMDHEYVENKLVPDPDSPGKFIEIPMTFEYVPKHYGTYFLTRKADDAHMIGGFGVGSKSPMTYTDLFVVENRKNGRKTVYHIYKEESCPHVSKKFDGPTTEIDGMTVSFSIAEKDFAEVVRKTADVLQYFQAQPRVLGATLPDVSYPVIRLSPSLELLPKHSVQLLVMGGVEYPLANFGQYAPKGFGKALFQMGSNRQGGFRLTVPVGTAMPTLSRESLDLNDATKQGLSRAFSLAEHEVELAIEAAYAQPGTLVDKLQATAIYSDLFCKQQFAEYAKASFSPTLIKKLSEWYRGIALPEIDLPFKLSICTSATTVRIVQRGHFKEGQSVLTSCHIRGCYWNPPCVWIRDVSHVRSRLSWYFSQQGLPDCNQYVADVDMTDPTQTTAFNDWIAAIGNPTVRKLSEIVPPFPLSTPRNKSTAGSTQLDLKRCLVLTLTLDNNGNFNLNYIRKANFTIDKKVPYLISKGEHWFSGVIPHQRYYNYRENGFHFMALMARALGLPDSLWNTLYIVPNTEEKRMRALGGWPFEAPLLEALANPETQRKLAKQLNHSVCLENISIEPGPQELTEIIAALLNPQPKPKSQLAEWQDLLAGTQLSQLVRKLQPLVKKGKSQANLISAIQTQMAGNDRVYANVDWSFLTDIWTETSLRQILVESYPLLLSLSVTNSHHKAYLEWCETQPGFPLPGFIRNIGERLHLIPECPTAPALQDETPDAYRKVA